MSLFKARDWWQAQCGHGEEFDMYCLLVANVDNDPSGQAKIVTGSFAGMLRVYLPRDRGYRAEDLLLEVAVDGGPILALAAGRFSGLGALQLAVLHPRKLVVYNLSGAGGGSYLQLNRLYEHWLEHTAANMTHGPFGGVQGADFICVQSYDGQVSFLEAEAAAFSRYLPNFLVPGPLCYVDVSDSFITCTAAMELECYKYKVLAAASPDKVAAQASSTGGAGMPTSPPSSSKKIQADWRIVLGEAAIDIRVGRFSQGLSGHSVDVVVLGEHNLFVLSSTGQITFQKRLEYHPACCTTYPVPGAKSQGGTENLLVATHTKALLVYRSSMLTWAAKADMQPVAMAVADMPGIRGAIVSLDDSGSLSVMYLGTDPLLNPVGFADTKDLDYEAMAREHRSLAQVIREHGGGGAQRLVDATDKLLLRAQVPQRLDAARPGGQFSGDGRESEDGLSSLGGSTPTGRRLTIKIYMVLQGGGSTANGITVTVSAPDPLTVETPEVHVPYVSINPNDPTLLQVTLRTGTGLPAAAIATVVATYATPSGEPRSQRLDVALPLCAFCQVVPPVKNAEFKVTLTTNRAPPPLTAIFEDALASAPPGVVNSMSSSGLPGGGNSVTGSASVISFQYYGGAADVTILVSKAGGRYRIQSDALDGMWFVASELASRLRNYFAEAEGGMSTPEGLFAVTYDDALPLEDYLEAVEQHFSARQAVSSLRQKLEDRAVQFRNVEKRLLMRFKDKNPSPLNQLDQLLLETYDGLMELGNSMEAAQAALATASRRLAGSTQLLLLLARWRFGMSDAEYSVIKSALPPHVIDNDEVGWEEMAEAALTHLLRTSLAKNAKEQAVQVAPLAPAQSTERLRKHLSLVLERLAKGMRLATPGDDSYGGAGSGSAGMMMAERSSSGRPLYREPPSPDPIMPIQEPPTSFINVGANGGGGAPAMTMSVHEEASAMDAALVGGDAGGGGGGMRSLMASASTKWGRDISADFGGGPAAMSGSGGGALESPTGLGGAEGLAMGSGRYGSGHYGSGHYGSGGGASSVNGDDSIQDDVDSPFRRRAGAGAGEGLVRNGSPSGVGYQSVSEYNHGAR